MGKTFYAEKGNSFIPIGIGFLILLAPVIAIWLDPNDDFSFSFHWLAIFPIAIFGFFTYVLISATLNLFTSFTISSKGIQIYKPPFHTRLFSIDMIKEVKLCSDEETRKIIEASIIEQNSYSESADIIGYIKMIKKRSPAFRYFTIAPRAKVSTSGPKESLTSLNIKPTGTSITLILKNGDEFYLTPYNAEEFKMEFDRIFKW